MKDLTQIAEAGARFAAGHPLWVSALATAAFAGLARWLRGVSRSGALAGAVVGFLLFAGAGPAAFAGLLTVFTLAWIATRVGYKRKQHLGSAEKYGGRSAAQVLANLGVAAICAVAHAVSSHEIFLLGLAASLSEAAADTVSSELGQAVSENVRLITTWEPVPAGTNGGVSLAGTVAGLAAAALVSLVCGVAGLLPGPWVWGSALAGGIGMVADSYLGAWLERRQVLGNEAVNFLGTLAAASSAALLYLAG